MNQGLASGSVTPESSREAAPDVLRRVPLDTSADATREYTVLTSRNPPAEAPMDPTLLHDNGCCRVHPDQVSVAGGTPEPPRLAATDATLQNLIDKLDATRDTVILPSLQPPEEAPMEPRRSHDPGYCRALPDYASGYGAMPEAAPSSDPHPATALPNSTQAALRSFFESAMLSHPSQTSSCAESSVEAKPPSVSFSDSGSDGSAYAKAPSRATADTRPTPAPPTFTPAARSLPASNGTAERTLVPNRRPPNTPTVTKLMQELERDGQRRTRLVQK